jgi:hypothetical protein
MPTKSEIEWIWELRRNKPREELMQEMDLLKTKLQVVLSLLSCSDFDSDSDSTEEASAASGEASDSASGEA